MNKRPTIREIAAAERRYFFPTNRAYLTLTVKDTRETLLDRVMVDVFGDMTDLDTAIKELTALKMLANGVANQHGHALRDCTLKIEPCKDL